MSRQVLTGPTACAVADVAAEIARLIDAPPTPETLAVVHAVAWPAHDPESLRGAALLAESALAGESAERLRLDHARLFTGLAGRPPVAPPAAPDVAAPALTGLSGELAAAGVLLVQDTPASVTLALRALAVLLPAAPQHLATQTERWRRELRTQHLITWAPGCLTRIQLGAQTFFYQGVAALGLGLLRGTAAEH